MVIAAMRQYCAAAGAKKGRLASYSSRSADMVAWLRALAEVYGDRDGTGAIRYGLRGGLEQSDEG
jgi:hypothetical protein